jgi:benzoylsuccinyl-CoA thiolase BbsB subunit
VTGEIVILGAGMTSFGRFPEMAYYKLAADAILEALSDAGIEWKDIQVVYCANTNNGMCPGEMAEAELGHTGIPVINVQNACAGGQTACLMGYQAIASGAYDIVLVLGVEQMPKGAVVGMPPMPTMLMGADSFVGKYAMKMQRAIYENRYTLDQMAKVSVKNHKNACYNPRSQYKLKLTIQDVHNSRVIAYPLTLYHCCPTSDGAAALVLCSERVAGRHATPPFVKMAGGALRSQTFVAGDPADTHEITINTAKEAYEKTGIGPEDIDIVELHDNFTISELEHYEELGLCGDGEGGRLIDEGATEITGRIPVSTSGGLLGKGHPMAATGVAQVCEIVWQMRGEAGQRQVNDVKVGLSNCNGGDQGMACGIIIIKK